MRFKDRIETTKLLAEKLKGLCGKNPIVLGIPGEPYLWPNPLSVVELQPIQL